MNKYGLLFVGLPGVAFFSLALVDNGIPEFSTLILPIVVIILLVLVNGLFVAAEFAIIGVRPSQIEQLVQSGVRKATKIQELLNSPEKQDHYIATAQLGITIASLGLGMYGESQIAHFIEPYLEQLLGQRVELAVLHTVASIVAVSILTYLHVVVGEMVPKSVSLASPVKAVLRLSTAMGVAQTILDIPVKILNSIGRMLLRAFKIPPAEGHARLHSTEELELIVSESAEEGLLLEEEEEMILNIFEFGERQVGQVMTPRPRVQAIPHDIPLSDLLQLVTSSRHTRFPVFESDLDHVIGLLHLKDLVRQQLLNGDFDLRQILRPAPAIPEDQPVEHLLSAFKRERNHMAIVLDEFGGLAGIVTLEDLVEEIVGEVRDEFDVEKEPLVVLGRGLLEVAGNYLVDDLDNYVFLGEPEQLPDVETVGGLIISWLGRPPQIGDAVQLPHNHHVRLMVLDVEGLAVTRAKVEYPVEMGEVEAADSSESKE